ncbi:MAG: hypothetical protein AB7O62_00115 [Pirellulales bacterium]
MLTLDEQRRAVAGDVADLRGAIGRGADLRIYSEFVHNEHIDVRSNCDEPIHESMDMRCTYAIDRRWVAGALTLRQPVELPVGFGPRPSLSLFMYNEDGQQAIARPQLDGPPATGPAGASPPSDHPGMPKYHELDRFDAQTNAPSSNFIYDFDQLRYFVREDWREVLAHDGTGQVTFGSVDALAAALDAGAEFKVGVADLCSDLHGGTPLPHEVFIQCGSCYYYTRRKLFIAATHPLVRIGPAIPLRYRGGNWDYAWLVVRSDGHVSQLRYDPYTLRPSRHEVHLATRWFIR